MKVQKPRIGDVYEVPIRKGFAYIQFTHMTPEDKFPVVRVLPGIYSFRPQDIGALVGQHELYFAIYVLPYALKAGQITLVSHHVIPEWARKYPIMRLPWDTGQAQKASWLIGPVDTPQTIEGLQSMVHVRELTPEQRRLSVRAIYSHVGLVRLLECGWTPEQGDDVPPERCAKTADGKNDVPQDESWNRRGNTEFYLYFGRKKNAEAAGKRLRDRQWTTIIRKSADTKQWLLLVTVGHGQAEDSLAIDEELEVIAQTFGGEYDGSGTSIQK